jgi:hypothetical protein
VYQRTPEVARAHGVFVSPDWPPDDEENVAGTTVVTFEIPERLFNRHSQDDPYRPRRRAMIPAKELYPYLPSARELTQQEQDDLSRLGRE